MPRLVRATSPGVERRSTTRPGVVASAGSPLGGPLASFPTGARKVSRMFVSSPASTPLLERRLLVAASGGDQQAMCLLLRRYQPVAHAVARRVRVPLGVDRE